MPDRSPFKPTEGLMQIKKFFLISLFCFSATTLLFSAMPQAASDMDSSQGSDKEPQYGSVEERRLMVALQQERSTLEQERQALENKKKELKRLEEEVDKKLDQLKALRSRLEQLLADKDAAELKRIQDLSKMYEKMSPDKAAKIFNSIDQGLAIAILEKMKVKAAARVLNNMDRERAASITTGFSSLETKK